MRWLLGSVRVWLAVSDGSEATKRRSRSPPQVRTQSEALYKCAFGFCMAGTFGCCAAGFVQYRSSGGHAQQGGNSHIFDMKEKKKGRFENDRNRINTS